MKINTSINIKYSIFRGGCQGVYFCITKWGFVVRKLRGRREGKKEGRRRD